MVGLPQTKGDFKLQNSEGAVPEGRHRIHLNALHATSPNELQSTKPTYSSSPIPGGMSNWQGEVIILCSRRCPKGGIQVSSGARERHSVRVTFYFDVSASVSCGEKRDFPRIRLFIAVLFPPHTCTWSILIGWTQ